MELYVSEFSKYVIALLITIYTYECFAVFRYEDEERRSGIYTRQNIIMFAFHFSCFLVICFETGDITYLFFYAFQQIVLYAAVMLFRMLYPKTNRLVINNMCMLLSIGFVILTRLDLNKAIKQFIIVSGSLAIALILPFFVHKFKFLKNLKWIYAIVGISALSVVMILGQTTYGSKLSFSIAGITFQPSEFVKILFVFFVASALYKASGFFEVFTTAVVAAAHVIVLVISRDLGSALIFFMVYVLMVFVASRNFLYILAGAAGGTGAAYVAYKVFRHVQVRVQAWKDPWSVIDSQGYQITQSLFAVSTGGFWGRGLFQGNPGTIPYVEEDFVFSAIAEELGIVVGICILLIALNCFVLLMKLSMEIKDKFYQLLAAGIGIVYLFQVFLTVGGGTKFIPMTGVTLPFISYGGSSILTSLILFYAAQGIFIAKKLEDIEYERKKEEFLRRRNAGRSVDRHRS